ncbi:haloacid dehalogenase type II [Blastochloris tepida]|uniref:(S)-2-haloacid dehalogenase n=1 Tax=Blastochloris tepida TaxID=2233851 RepID=A0A348G3G5_9HYPH|nr:haloacid dehalogenase type II [Blastochloris tepida]BBF94098.1 haloacid dehalogenase [Blastochloris tepida]
MPVRAVVFDAYGTLFDVTAAVRRHDAAVGPRAAELSALWRQRHLEYSWTLTLMGRYRPFWDLAEQALDTALGLTGVDPALKPRLLAAYRTLDAYPEVGGMLARLRAGGLATAILSNGTPDMLADALAASGLADRFDHVLSVDAVRLYKPRPEVYALATAALGVAGEEIAFVSSNRWDIAGAAAFGFRPVWVNRSGAPAEYDGLDPIATLSGLDALPDLLLD